jgi:hypothetical protein
VAATLQKVQPLPTGETVGLSSATTARRAALGEVYVWPHSGPLHTVTCWDSGSYVASTWVPA